MSDTNGATSHEQRPVEKVPPVKAVSPEVQQPRSLTADPILGTRDGWNWCSNCSGIQPPGHEHDELEDLSRDELLRLVRVLTAKRGKR